MSYLRKQQQKTNENDLFQIEVHITEHCNLKCSGCWHFSPLAEEIFLDTESFEKDCMRLSQITKKLAVIKLLGGEPLLHPNLTKFFEIARKYFQNTLIQLTTNGILLAQQSDDFWNSCNKNRVTISISRYPINIDTNEIEELASKHQVYLIYDENRARTADSLKRDIYKLPLDLNGKQNSVKTFFGCWVKNGCCVTLRDGKIYTCFTAAHIQFFNKYFNQNLCITEKDYVDIYKIHNVEEINIFLKKPFPFCRYCKPSELIPIEWSVAKKHISEWT
jgi:MoaA/NifB/PqqE/SkfB family radical SAM enzyme